MAAAHHTTQLVIIGSGPAGLTAAIYAGRARLKPIVIEGNNPGGQLMGTTIVENWPGIKSIMGPKLMMDMQEQARSCGTEFISGQATDIDTSTRPFIITTNKGVTIAADTVIIATGAVPKRLGVPGEQEYWGKGVTSCAVCDGAFYKDKKVIIVGGGDTAMEDASFMTKFTNDITIVHILDKLTASAAMQERVLNNAAIKIIYASTISSIKGNGEHVTNVSITNQHTGKEQEISTDAVFVAIGYSPKTDMFKGKLDMDSFGYIKVTNHTLTSIPGIFSAGDVADYRYRQAVTSAGSGCMAALDAERYLAHTTK
jgi:thioredoxin reductase (NADPH)